MNRKYHVKLTAKERKELQTMIHDVKTPKSIRNRCHVLLLADENVGKPPIQQEISVRCGVSDVTVYKLIKDYYTQGMGHCLRKRKHVKPPNPPIVSGEIEARIVALACGSSPEGRTRWTVRLLAEKVVELGIMERVSYETIRTTLKKRSSSLT